MQTIVIEEAFRVPDVDASCALTQAALNKPIDVPVKSRKTGEALNVSNSFVLSKGSIKKPKSGVTDSEGAGLLLQSIARFLARRCIGNRGGTLDRRQVERL